MAMLVADGFTALLVQARLIWLELVAVAVRLVGLAGTAIVVALTVPEKADVPAEL